MSRDINSEPGCEVVLVLLAECGRGRSVSSHKVHAMRFKTRDTTAKCLERCPKTWWCFQPSNHDVDTTGVQGMGVISGSIHSLCSCKFLAVTRTYPA